MVGAAVHDKMFDFAVIGKGLFGSAAARYLSQGAARVVLIGPDEPADWANHDGVFASHYDEARIVSQSAPDVIWQQLELASIAAFMEIERESGVAFLRQTGRLTAIPHVEPAYYPYLAAQSPNCQPYTPETTPSATLYQFPAAYDAVYEAAPSGYLNPRALILAQCQLAERQGAQIVRKLATALSPMEESCVIELADGSTLQARQVLLATGAFSNCYALLHRKLAAKAETITTVLGEVSVKTARQLNGLPPLNWRVAGGPLTHISILPPLRYPDGRCYFKFSVFSDADKGLPDLGAMQQWFQACPDFVYLDNLKAVIADLMPTVAWLSWQTKPCIATYTPMMKPMVDCLVPDRIYTAIAGIAGAAHSSDAIGKLAADLMMGEEWPSAIPREPFRVQFADEWRGWMGQATSVWHE